MVMQRLGTTCLRIAVISTAAAALLSCDRLPELLDVLDGGRPDADGRGDGVPPAGEVEVGEGESCEGYGPPPVRVCKAGLFCRLPCTLIDASGVCEVSPTACTREYNPVCGCHGQTFGNDCTRRAARVGLDHTGECRPGAVCGGIAGLPCGDGLFCELPANMCQVADLAGTCRTAWRLCNTPFDPVCGCNGTTYVNDCERRVAGVAKDHDGACP